MKPFYIGRLLVDPPVLSAPMAGFTNAAFRELLRLLGGTGLVATEMVSARAFHHIDRRGGEPPLRLEGVKDEPRPLAVQIWDNDPDTLSHLGRVLATEYNVSVVDLNFGCPARAIAQRVESGSWLLQHPDRLGKIVERVVAAARPVPVTAKIRLGFTRDTINARDVAQSVESAGAAALTVHGRTAADMYRGTADWEEIAKIKPVLKKIPLIGNGDIDSVHVAMERFRRYPVDGIMIGRAGLMQPWLFRQVAAAIRGEDVPPEPSLAEQKSLLLSHFEMVRKRFVPETAVILMRKFACNYSHGKPGARKFRALISSVETITEFLHIVESHFPTDIEP